jgi:hypothetical protein
MKRIAIDVIFVAIQVLDFLFRQPRRPLRSEEITFNFLISGLLAVFGFSLLLRFVKIKNPWFFLIDAIFLSLLKTYLIKPSTKPVRSGLV